VDAPLQRRPSNQELAPGEEVGDFKILKEGLARARAEMAAPTGRMAGGTGKVL